MKFVIDGKKYDYDGKLTVEDAMFLYDKSQVGLTGFNRALLVEGNPHVIAAWMFLLKRRAGEAIRWDDVLKLDMSTFDFEPDVPTEDEAAGPVEADPT